MLRKSSEGFTLIEMLIVIAVISILAGIVLVGITGFQSSARDTKRIGDLRSVQNSLELYYTRCGHYPHTGSCGTAAGAATGGTWADLSTALSAAQVAERLPEDPRTDFSYEYRYGENGYAYVLKATLENDSSALEGDNTGSELDGDQYGANCNDSELAYCIGSS